MNDFNNISRLLNGGTLTDWNNILKQVHPEDRSHLILCENTNSKNITLITHFEYDSNQYRKLSLAEIVNFTRNILNPPTIVNINNLRLFKIIMSDDVFKEDMRARTIDCLNEIENESQVFTEIKKKLSDMSQHALDKRTIEKTKNIWGYIQYYIYSWFFDQSSAIETMTCKKTNTNYKNEATAQIRNRILMNMIYFEEKEETTEKYGDLFAEDLPELDSIFSTPTDVSKKWLTKYHPDKYIARDKDAAEIYQKRIIILNNLWKAVLVRHVTETNFDQVNLEVLLLEQ